MIFTFTTDRFFYLIKKREIVYFRKRFFFSSRLSSLLYSLFVLLLSLQLRLSIMAYRYLLSVSVIGGFVWLQKTVFVGSLLNFIRVVFLVISLLNLSCDFLGQTMARDLGVCMNCWDLFRDFWLLKIRRDYFVFCEFVRFRVRYKLRVRGKVRFNWIFFFSSWYCLFDFDFVPAPLIIYINFFLLFLIFYNIIFLSFCSCGFLNLSLFIISGNFPEASDEELTESVLSS